MTICKIFLAVLVLFLNIIANYKPDEVVIFKKFKKGKPLSLYLFKPKLESKKKIPCIIFFLEVVG